MQVIVNDEPTDEFGRPRDNETIDQFLETVANQLNEQNKGIGEVKVDGEFLDEELAQQECGEVETIELQVNTMEELLVDSIGRIGSYSHQVLNRIPNILSEWDEQTREQVDQYRRQMRESLEATVQVLSSVEPLTNLSLEDINVEEMTEKGIEIQQELADEGRDRVREILENRVRPYFQELLDTLQDVLDRLAERRENLLDELDSVEETIDHLSDTISDMIEQAQKEENDPSSWFNLNRVTDAASELTRVNQVFETLNNTGKLQNLFPEDQQDQVKDTLTELREGIGRLYRLLEDQDPTEIVKTLRKDVQPYVKEARQYIHELNKKPEETQAE